MDARDQYEHDQALFLQSIRNIAENLSRYDSRIKTINLYDNRDPTLNETQLTSLSVTHAQRIVSIGEGLILTLDGTAICFPIHGGEAFRALDITAFLMFQILGETESYTQATHMLAPYLTMVHELAQTLV